MRPHATGGLASLLWLLTATAFLFGLVAEAWELQDLPFMVSFGAYATVGAVVATRRPENPLGWIFIAIGILTALAAAGTAVAERGFDARESVPAPVIVGAWIQTWFWYPLVAMATLFTMLLFPSGLPSPRWRPVLWTSVAAVAVVTTMAAHAPTLEAAGRHFPNPFRLPGLNVQDVESTPLFSLLTALLLVGIGAALVSLVVRFRRARGLERQQLKWFVYAAVVLAAVFLASALFPAYERSDTSGYVFGFAIGLVPISCGIAILRYRLYDIDHIINRTLVYVALTAVLVLVYAAGVVGVGGIARALAGGETNSIVVAASTLGVAALFAPARARIQGFIDRRFYRDRYDAVQTLEFFAARLRREVDLDAITKDLLEVVGRTMQPRNVSLWLRRPTRSA